MQLAGWWLKLSEAVPLLGPWRLWRRLMTSLLIRCTVQLYSDAPAMVIGSSFFACPAKDLHLA